MRNYPSMKTFSIMIAMLLAAMFAMILKPSQKIAYQGPKVSLEALVPTSFGNWEQDDIQMPVVNPEVQAALNKVYAQTLSRTYINKKGDRIMLSIAYGQDQSDNLSIHLPEGCYQGQGFAVENKTNAVLNTQFGNIPIVKLIASKGLRVEPITYWITIGNKTVESAWEMKKTKLAYTIKGEVPDGTLVRISSISQDSSDAYRIQQDFANEMLNNMTPEQRNKLMGTGDN